MSNQTSQVNIKSYNIAYKKRDKDKCIEEIFKLRETYKDKFRHIFLISDCLKNPMGRNFNEDEKQFVIDILDEAIAKAEEKSDYTLQSILGEFKLLNTVLFNNAKNNEKKLLENTFSKYSLVEQLLMISIFIQDQTRLMYKKNRSSYTNKKFITGMEMDISTEKVRFNEDEKVSLMDNYEGMLEQFDILIRYLFYHKREELNNESIDKIEYNITPYYIQSFEEVGYISHIRKLYISLEEKFRYNNWGIKEIKANNPSCGVLFNSSIQEEEKAKIIGTTRKKYHANTIAYSYCSVNEKSLKTAYSNINKLSDKYFGKNIEVWEIDKNLYNSAKIIVKPLIDSFKNLAKETYLNATFNGIETKDYLKCFEFLFIISEIYINIKMRDFDENIKSHYKDLVPIVKNEWLITQLANLYNYDKEYAEKLVKSFVLDETIKNGEGDIFTLPLIKVSKSEVLLCNSLIAQVNLERSIEILLSRYNVDLSVMGVEFEKKIRGKISLCQGIEVNKNKVRFMAFDDKEVEFDFIGMFNDYLLLIETKAMLNPYDPKEIFKAKKTLTEGVNQVLRRCEVIKHNWEEIKEAVNIQLPEKPVEYDKIIKIVCTNVYEFTGLCYDGVRIVDESTLLKYFIDPHVSIFGKKEDGIVFKSESLWKKGIPEPSEFIEYLKNPITISDIPKYLKKEYKRLPFFEGEVPIEFEDFIFEEDPYSAIINNKMKMEASKESKLFKKVSKQSKAIKIGRNDKCYCGSGKKYKKCCGK